MNESRTPTRVSDSPVVSELHGMQAVKFPRFGRIAFLAVPIPEQLRLALQELGGETIGGVTLEEPEDAYDWPEGAEAPAPVLGVSRDEPTHFRLFKTSDELGSHRYVPTGMTHVVYHDAGQFAAFVDTLRSLDRIAGHTDETDTEAVWDEIIRDLNRLDSQGVR
jgi:hypothetical protein